MSCVTYLSFALIFAVTDSSLCSVTGHRYRIRNLLFALLWPVWCVIIIVWIFSIQRRLPQEG